MKPSPTPLVLFVLALGCGGSDETAPNGGSVSQVAPGTLFVGRTTEVTVSGNGTHFSGQPRVDFGDAAMKTTRVDVLSPTSLRVEIEVGDEASSGPHDVTVTTVGIGDTKDEVATSKGGLIIAAPIKHDVGGTVPQGGVIDFALVNLDKDNLFTSAPVFVSGGVLAKITEMTPERITGSLLIDALAPAGPLRVRLSVKNAKGQDVSFASAGDDPLAPKVTPSNPILQLVPGKVEGNEAIRAPHGSNLYKSTVPGEDHVFVLSMGTVGGALKSTSGARLLGAFAPPTGRFGDGAPFDTTYDNAAGGRVAVGLARTAGDAYFGVHTSDLSGGPSEYNYSVKVAFAKATSFSMKEPSPSDAPGTPLATIDVDAPAFAVDGAIDTRGDADYVIFTPAKAGRIFVAAVPLNSGVPLNVAIFGNDPGTASCSAFMAGGLGTRQAEIKAVAGTPYCARVNTTTPMTTKYSLVVTPEL